MYMIAGALKVLNFHLDGAEAAERRSQADKQKNRYTDRQIDRQTDRFTDRQTNRHT